MLAQFIVWAVVLESSLAQLTGPARSVDGHLMWGKIESSLKMGVLLFLGSRVLVLPKWIERIAWTFAVAGGLLGVWTNDHGSGKRWRWGLRATARWSSLLDEDLEVAVALSDGHGFEADAVEVRLAAGV